MVAMTAVSLLLLAMTATSVLAESSVHFREQFEDGGEVLYAAIYNCTVVSNCNSVNKADFIVFSQCTSDETKG